MGKNISPIFLQKMMFPVYYPVLNDKIVLRMWHSEERSSDQFIGNIPEVPKHNDFFNITKLISMGGRMAAKWINIYCIPPPERNKGLQIDKILHPKEGTAFVGRVLLSFSCIPNESPSFCVSPCNSFYVNN